MIDSDCRWWLIHWSYVDLGPHPQRLTVSGAVRACSPRSGTPRRPCGRRAVMTSWSTPWDWSPSCPAALAAVEAGAVAEVEARDLATQGLRFGSTGDWLTHTGGLRRGEGKQRVVRAKALTGPLPEDVRGAGGRDRVPGPGRHHRHRGRRPPARRAASGGAGRRSCVTQAARLNGSELARAGRHLVHVVDPDAADRKLQAALEREERAAHLDRYLAITEDRAGGVWIKGHGTAEDGALLTAALLPLTRPEPADPAATDQETDEPHARAPRPGPARVRRPAVGRPGAAGPTRPGHRPGPRHPRHPTQTPDHPRPPHPDRRPESRRDRGSGPLRTAPTCHPGSCAASPATPRSSPPSSAPAPKSSTSAAPAAWSPPPSGPPS